MSTPTVYIIIGTAGSGKSLRARRIAHHLHAAYLDKDAMSGRFVEAGLVAAGYEAGDRESNDYYTTTLLPLEYDSLLDVAGQNLRLGNSVVLDAPFSPFLADPEFVASARRRFGWPAEAHIKVIQIHVAPELLKARLRARGLARDAAKLADWDSYWAQHGNVTCAWRGVELRQIHKDTDEDDELTDDSNLLI
ncbi:MULTISPECIES: ATP-binding protein [unclassified Actinomyces]|uniref:AAA family ATPase n=3 Tax=Actinomyces TaxID=1654 RepID=UPI000D58E757|nr:MULTISPECIES: ATP-binding protein [unclassified Actinomyces]RAX22648.1 ATP-binding protein [Actinomyces sp. Z3]